MHKTGDQDLQLAMIGIDTRCNGWNIQKARGPDDHAHDHPEDLKVEVQASDIDNCASKCLSASHDGARPSSLTGVHLYADHFHLIP